MEENKFDIMVFEEADCDQIFENIRKIKSDSTPEEINKAVSGEFPSPLIIAQPFTQEIIEKVSFYRARVYNPGKDNPVNEQDPQAFGYPPEEFCKLGRCNRPGQQVLYTSTDEHAPFHEVADKITPGISIVYLSKWKIKKLPEGRYYRNFFLGLDTQPGTYAELMAGELNKRIEEMLSKMPERFRKLLLYGQKKYAELFTDSSKDLYHITSSLIYDSIIKKIKPDVPAIGYPSVAKSKTHVNFVFRKDFVDEYMEVVEVKKVIVKRLEHESVDLTFLQKAEVIEGKVNWYSLRASNAKFNFDQVYAVLKNNSNKPVHIGSDSILTSGKPNHSYSIEQFLEHHKININDVLKVLADFPVNMSMEKIPTLVERAMVINTTGEIYIQGKISKKQLVTNFVIPVTYSLDYESSMSQLNGRQ